MLKDNSFEDNEPKMSHRVASQADLWGANVLRKWLDLAVFRDGGSNVGYVWPRPHVQASTCLWRTTA